MSRASLVADRSVESLAAFSSTLSYSDLPADTIHAGKRLLIDSLGCAIAALGEPAFVTTRDATTAIGGAGHVPMVGGTAPDVAWATFLNGFLIRCLDFNDFYQAPGVKTGGHPSDLFAPALAVASADAKDGRALLLGGVIGWEIYAITSDAIERKVLDQGMYASIAAACVASNLLGLSEDQTRNAIGIASVANLSALATRYGQVSMWKSAAVPYACKNGVEAAVLAHGGVVGPETPLEGKYGALKVATGSPELLRAPREGGEPFRIHRSSIKHFPIGSMAQTAIECALAICERIQGPGSIRRVRVGTFPEARAMMADAEKWRPATREAADHSMPFGIALALVHGRVELDHFTEAYFRDPDVLALVDKIDVDVSEEAAAVHPEERLAIVEVETVGGEVFAERSGYHRGHPKNPMSDSEIEEKFRSLTVRHLGDARASELLEVLWSVDEVTRIGDLLQLTIPV